MLFICRRIFWELSVSSIQKRNSLSFCYIWQIFQEGIHGHCSHGTATWASNRRYLLSPINGVLKYHRLGKQERHDPEIPFEKSSLVLSDVSIAISESQYYDGIKLLETFSRYKTRVDICHLRPVVPISKDPQSLVEVSVLAGVQQKKLCYWFSWDKIKLLCQLRRCYVHLYVNTLQHSPNADVSEIRQIERILDSKVIILWRLLAHAKFAYVKSKEASEQKGSWWSFSWYVECRDNFSVCHFCLCYVSNIKSCKYFAHAYVL
ncbi:hypothetical protein Cni_G27252 [Canna indica]|uniref:Uncharacterized protein n=1 Tax=Canna indica TaxID=4628 RepID=A0AAQ3QMT2_9LILI|nr:hypothetical protein Cni_G27252 [Canna indica]